MKTFFKTILYGLQAIFYSTMSVSSIAVAIIVFVNLHTRVGWWVLVYFSIALFALVLGILFMSMLGYSIINSKQENYEEESR